MLRLSRYGHNLIFPWLCPRQYRGRAAADRAAVVPADIAVGLAATNSAASPASSAKHRDGRCPGTCRGKYRSGAAASAMTIIAGRAVRSVISQLELFEPAFYISRPCRVRNRSALG